jgi:ABC-2 type transport system permease protein
MWSRLKPLVIKEFRQVRRDRLSLGLLLVLPAFMLFMFGYAVTFDVKHISLGVLDLDVSDQSRQLVTYCTSSEYFDLVRVFGHHREIDAALDEGRVRVAMVIPRGFGMSVNAGRNADVQFLIDGANAQAAATTAGYVNAMMQNYSLKTLADLWQRRTGQTLRLPVDLHPRVWYNPELASAKFLITGLIGFIMMVTAVISTALSVVRERERGTLEQLLVSPVRPVELILGKTLPYVFISLAGLIIIIGVGYVAFEVRVVGSWLMLFLVSVLFLVGNLGFGLLISTLADSQQLAFMISIMTTLLPNFILSGFVFPIQNMPWVVQGITHVFPARYFLVVLRAIMLKGAGPAAYWDQLIFLTVYAVVVLGVAVLRMRRRGL